MSDQMLQPQSVERRVNERVVRQGGGPIAKSGGRGLASGIGGGMYDDYDIPTFFKNQD